MEIKVGIVSWPFLTADPLANGKPKMKNEIKNNVVIYDLYARLYFQCLA